MENGGLWAPVDGAEFDVIVAGSGAAGLTAALAAAAGGAKVLVLEKSRLIGGTSAMSGAGTWIPCNRLARDAGIADSRQEALDYLRSASPKGWQETEDDLWQSFIAHAAEMIDFVEGHTPLRYQLIAEPDPMAEQPGGKIIGRMISPKPLPRRLIGPLAGRLRPSTLPHLFTYRELVMENLYHAPFFTFLKCAPRLAWRWFNDARGQGSALVTGLVKGCIDRKCKLSLQSRVTELISDPQGAVTGVTAVIEGNNYSIAAKRGVVLATGGFEWDPELLSRYFPGGVERLGSPSSNEGDGQRLAEAAGARLERMDQANIYPCLPTRYEGRLHGVPITFQAEPHAILVNRNGRRFVSEYDYNLGEALDKRDAATGLPINFPAWVIGDERVWASSFPLRWYANKQPGWVKRANTLKDLAQLAKLPAEALAATVERWNRSCERGMDPDFHRGESVWERYKSKGGLNGSNGALGAIERAPFIAMSLNRSILGTKGGARTNSKGEVLRNDGTVITGLYAAGNAMANPIGTRALGAGTTIGPCMTWGYICGKTILASNR
jgi:3-oxosteroid 1-dehydrogenase